MREYSYKAHMRMRGFTLYELIIVITIITVLAILILSYLGSSKAKGRDAALEVQAQEIMKSLELLYADNGNYPPPPPAGVSGQIKGPLTDPDIAAALVAHNTYFSRVPDNPERFYYCSDGARSYALLINTEEDKGGSDYCHITRGPGTTPGVGFGCFFSGVGPDVEAEDPCLKRF